MVDKNLAYKSEGVWEKSSCWFLITPSVRPTCRLDTLADHAVLVVSTPLLPFQLLSISHALSLKVSEGMAWRPVAGVQKPANVRFTVLVSSRLLDCKQAR